jgi:membrane protein DedA with SNARE-associated domain
VLEELLANYGYLAIFVITFLEGESIVILAGIFAAQGIMSLEYIIACATVGGFLGDQMYYTIGRRWGKKLLDKKPGLRKRIEWAFKLVRKCETCFILSYRYLYGVRNIAPFVVAMSGVSRRRFVVLNLIATFIWAVSFAGGGYIFGHVLEEWLGEFKDYVIYTLVGLAVGFALYSMGKKIRGWRNNKNTSEDTSTAASTESDTTSPPAPQEAERNKSNAAE